MKKEQAKRKGLFAVIRESMNKTGGCCGPGETCGGPTKEKSKEAGEDEDVKEPEKDVEK